MPKSARGDLIWDGRPNHAGHQICTAVLIDADGVTVPGLTIALEVKAPVFVDSCMYLFTVYKLIHGRKERAYQLEVVPTAKRSHNGPEGTFYGPHEHYGEQAFPVAVPEVHCGNWEACYRWFCTRCTLQPAPITLPC